MVRANGDVWLNSDAPEAAGTNSGASKPLGARMDGVCEIIIELAKGRSNAGLVLLLALVVVTVLTALCSRNPPAVLAVAVAALLLNVIFQLGC